MLVSHVQQIALHLDMKVWWLIPLSQLIPNDLIIFAIVFVVDFEYFRVKLSYFLLG